MATKDTVYQGNSAGVHASPAVKGLSVASQLGEQGQETGSFLQATYTGPRIEASSLRADCGANVCTQTSGSTVATGVACPTGPNAFARKFLASECTGGAQYTLKCVTCGIFNQTADTPFTVNVYEDTSGAAGTPVTANLVLVASKSITYLSTDPGLMTIELDAPVCFASGTYFVVEYVYPDPGGPPYPSCDTAPVTETAPGYMKSAPCGVTDYDTFANIGFPDTRLIIDLGGDDGCSAFGACCLSELAQYQGERCQIVDTNGGQTPAQNCADLGGTYLGDFTNCVPNPCLEPPPNDDCAAVTPDDLGAGGTVQWHGDNWGATTNGCDLLGPVAWEAFTISSCQTVTLNYCGSPTLFGTVYITFFDCPCGDTEVFWSFDELGWGTREDECCIDDPPGFEGNPYMKIYELPSGTYYYPIAYVSGDDASEGEYIINVEAVPCDASTMDCNNNGVHDFDDIDGGTSADCNGNFIPDECDCDWNADGVAGLLDYRQFQSCLETYDATPGECDCVLDHDGDADVDLYDFWWFQQCYDGPECVVCPVGATAEGEADCGLPEDTTNGGCNLATPVFSAIACGESVCGTFGNTDAGSRDTDWYAFTLTQTTEVTWSTMAEYPFLAGIIADGPGDCATTTTYLEVENPCTELVVTKCLPAGTHYAFVAPLFASQVIPETAAPCGTAYVGTLTCGTCGTGACCLTDGSCTDVANGVACDTAGGVFQGSGTTCAGTSCPAPPANDDCADAATIACGATVTFDTGAATTEAGDPTLSCGWNGAYQPTSGVWYTFQATASAVNITLCDTNPDNGQYDTLMGLFEGTCGAFTELACGEDACPTPDSPESPWYSQLTYSGLTIGNTYYVLVGTAEGGSPGEITMTITCTDCTGCLGGETAEAEPGPDSGVGVCPSYNPGEYEDTFNAGCNLDVDPGAGVEYRFSAINCGDTVCARAGYYSTNGGVSRDRRDTDWFEFFLTEQTDVSWTITSESNGAQALLIDLNAGCDGLTIVASAANTDADGLPTGCFAVTASATLFSGHYATWGGFAGTDVGGVDCGTEYRGELTCTHPADMMPSPADICSNALMINTSGYWSGDLNSNGYTYSGNRSMPCAGLPALDDGQVDMWWKYVAPCNGRVTFQTCGYDVENVSHGDTDIPTIIGIWTGDCGSLTQYDAPSPPTDPSEGCGGGFGGTGYDGSRHCETDRATVTIDVVLGQTYYFQVQTAAETGQFGKVTVDVSECVENCP